MFFSFTKHLTQAMKQTQVISVLQGLHYAVIFSHIRYTLLPIHL